MRRTWLAIYLVVTLAAFAGCTIQPVQPVSPAPQAQPQTDADATLTPAENVARLAVDALAEELQVPVAEMSVANVEEVEWPDACLGVYSADEMCAAVITPGFLVVIDTPGGQYEIHTDSSGDSMRIASER